MRNNIQQQMDDEIERFFSDPEKIRQVIQNGIQSELKKHKLAGNAICEWKDNEIHWIPADMIQIS
jgi:hypothetical protein